MLQQMRNRQVQCAMSLPVSVHKDEPTQHGSGLAAGSLSCLFYTVCSVCTVVANKYISFGMSTETKERLPEITVIMIQCAIAVVLVEFARMMKWVEYASFNMETAKAWLPVNLLFIGMLCSGLISFVYVSVPMITIFKNLTNLITVFGDWYLFNEK
jgi:GDP-mannose transporter